jgi:hypothetical protein
LAAALAGTAAVLALRRKATRPPDDPERRVGLNGAADPAEQAGTSTAAPARGWRWLRVSCSLLLPPAVMAAAIFAPVLRGAFAMRILIVATAVELVLAILLRRTNPGRDRWVTIILYVWLALLWLGSLLVLLGQLTEQVTFFQFQDQVDPVTTLVLVLVGILVLCVPAALLVARAETRRITEPALYTVIAIIIGLLCLPALRTLTRAAAAVTDNGSVTLYVAGRSRHFTLSNELTLPGIGSGQYGGKTQQHIQIFSSDRKSFRWALVLRGGARLTDPHLDPFSHAKDLGERDDFGVVQPTQLISGKSTDGIVPYALGLTVSTFAADTISRRTVTLPVFQVGDPISGGGRTQLEKDVVTALARPPTQAKVTISIEAGGLESQDSISSVSPPPSDPGSLHWRGPGPLNPSFTLVDSDRADTTQNVLFTIAVLLGVAASALLMAIQSTLSYLGSRTTP